MFKITNILVNYMGCPTGIVGKPQIGWRMESDINKNVKQTSYRLMISESPAFVSCIYDSGIVESDESAHHIIDVVLEDIRTYYIKVEVCDNYGNIGNAISMFTTGYQNIENWSGEFITVEKEDDKGESFGTLLRKEFTLTKTVDTAYFVGTAHGLYTAYLNGQKIGDDVFTPGWTSYNKHLLYQIYNLGCNLQKGENTLAVSLGAGWYKGKMSYNLNRNHYGTRTAFCGCIIVKYQDGSKEIISTDGSWKGCRGPILFSEIYDGEIYDARLEPQGWNMNGFNDSSWMPVQTVEQELSVLSPSQGKSVQIIDELSPQKLFMTPKGERVIDFGQNLTGWCRFKVEGAKEGDKIILKFFETLDAENNVYTDNLRSAKQTIEYTCAGGDAEYQPSFTYHGFRYMHIVSWPGEIKAENFTALALHTAMDSTGEFCCTNPAVNQLQHNILWSMKGNFLDVPTDCPQRDERLGWTGDVQIFNSTAIFLMNSYSFFAKWLKDVAFDQREDGAVAHIVPDIVSGKSAEDWLTGQGTYGASAWADVNIILPWNLYIAYGDTKIIHQQYDSMKAWIDFMTAHSEEGCLFNYMLQFGDWVALDAEEGSYFGATPTAFTSAAFYCYSTRLFAKMAAAIGKDEDAAHYSALAQELRRSFIEHFVNADGTLTVQTQTAHIVALHFDLVPEEHRKKVAAALKELLDAQNGHLVTGFIGTPYFCHALSDNGYVEDAYSLLLKEDFPSWLYQISKGATTVWEHWDGIKPDGSMWSPDMNSFNHYSYGSIGDWMYKNIGGLKADENVPGYKHFFLRPKLDSRMEGAAVKYNSIYGEIKCAWLQKEGNVDLKLTVPVNTSAELILDNAAEITETEDIVFEYKDGAPTAVLGSGEYCLRYKLR